MKKIPTLFVRDEEDRRYVTREVNPACQWVIDGEGIVTRKYDGTCVMFDGERWWARREVRPGKAAPPYYVPVDHDNVTGKTVGWEPIEQSAFVKYHAEVLRIWRNLHAAFSHDPMETRPGTYELFGPKINGNPENAENHKMYRHGDIGHYDAEELMLAPRDFDNLADWLYEHPGWEGLVWHHPDGRMAKIKRKDFPRSAV